MKETNKTWKISFHAILRLPSRLSFAFSFPYFNVMLLGMISIVVFPFFIIQSAAIHKLSSVDLMMVYPVLC